MTTVIFVRHGQSTANLERIFAGHTDAPLTELGHKQAENTAKFLQNYPICAIYSSDLSRAYDTANEHAKLRGMSVQKSQQLRELFLGEWENMQVDDIIANYGRESYYDGWRDNFGTYIIPGSEGAAKCADRIYGEIERICKSGEYERILIVSHGAAIRSFYAKVLGLHPTKIGKALPYPSNASYSVVTYNGKAFEAKEYSVDSHMEKIGITKVNW